MKRLLLAVVVLSGVVALAQSSIDGVWRVNLQNTQYVGQEKYSLDNGTFRCETCDPKIEAKADGQDHPVTGSPYADAVNVKVVDDRHVEIAFKKAGKPAASLKLAVSADGNSMTTDSTSQTQSGQTVTAEYSGKRVGAAGSGHKISGTWQPGKLASVSENAMDVTYKSTADGLTMSDKAGNSYTAKFDGKEYPYKGDPGISTIALRRIDANTIEETYRRDGKVIGVNHIQVAADGKSLAVVFEDKVRDVTVKWTADKR